MRWRNAWRRRGSDALKVGSSPGRPLKLKTAQRRRLLRLLLKGPLAHGYNTNVWTTARIVELIRREFGVSYHRAHIGRLMHNAEGFWLSVAAGKGWSVAEELDAATVS